LDTSPGQVWLLRGEPLMSRMRERPLFLRCVRSASWMRRRVSSHSRGSS
jgi:hypothetical protein